MPIDHEIDDIDILNQEPTRFWICDKKKRRKGIIKRKALVIDMLSIHEYYKVFIPMFINLIELIQKENDELILPDGKQWKEKNKLNTIRQYLRTAFSYNYVRKYLIQLVFKVGYLQNMSKRFFDKNVEPAQLIDVFLHIYKHNIDGFKKKVQIAVETVMGSDPLSLTYTEPLSTKGGLKEKLTPRFRQLPSSESPSLKSGSSLKENQNCKDKSTKSEKSKAKSKDSLQSNEQKTKVKKG